MRLCLICPCILLLLLSYSCRSGQYDDKAEIEINIDIDSLLKENVSIYDIFRKVELVGLDDVHPISNGVYVGASNIAFDGERYYILDAKTLTINVYDSQSRLINLSDKKGRGPGEYTMADQICHNRENNTIEILNPVGKILSYTVDSLRFKSETGLPKEKTFAVHNYFIDGGSYILYSDSADSQLWNFEPSENTLTSYGYESPAYLRRYISAQSPFLEIEGKPCFFRPYDGLIYRLDNKDSKLVPFISWNLGKYQCRLKNIPQDKTVREYHEFIIQNSAKAISPYIDIKSHGSALYASVIFDKGKTYTLFHDLATGESRFFEKTTEGMKFLPEISGDGKMFKFIDYKHLPEYVNKDILDAKSRTEYDNVLKNEGSAIIIYHTKPFASNAGCHESAKEND